MLPPRSRLILSIEVGPVATFTGICPEKVAPTPAEGATRSNGLGSLIRRAAVGRSVSKTQARNSGVGGYFFVVFFVAVAFGAVVFAGAFFAAAFFGALVVRLSATSCLNVAPTLNPTARVAASCSWAPVEGLRAVRAPRSRPWLSPVVTPRVRGVSLQLDRHPILNFVKRRR